MRASNNRGFTLMEVIIAVGITALIGGLVWSSFSEGLKAREMIEGEADIYRELRTGTSRMTREIAMAFVSENYDHARYRDNKDRPTFFTGEQDQLSFSMLGHQRLTRDAKESDQSIVFYKVDHDPEDKENRGYALMRCEKPVIDEEPDRCKDWEPLVTGIKKVTFSYWDNKRNDWVNQWDTRRNDHPNQLPDRVRIELMGKNELGKEQKYVTQARVFLITALGT